MKKLLFLLATAFVFSLGTASAGEGGECGDGTKLYAVKFHADYCGGCKALAPSLEALNTRLEGEAVEFVQFDFTTDASKEKAEKMASKMGLSEVYKSNEGTGYVLLVDAGSKKAVGKLTSMQSVDDMYKSTRKNQGLPNGHPF